MDNPDTFQHWADPEGPWHEQFLDGRTLGSATGNASPLPTPTDRLVLSS